MHKLPCDVVISFFRDGKFLWETDISEGSRGQSVDNLIGSCNKICKTFGTDVDWEIGIVSLRQGNGLDNLNTEIEKLSIELKKVFNN
jgi:hypothetical protein